MSQLGSAIVVIGREAVNPQFLILTIQSHDYLIEGLCWMEDTFMRWVISISLFSLEPGPFHEAPFVVT